MAQEIKLQALKDGVDVVEVNAVKVAPGDVVAADQPILEVQADKAALEVTAPTAGRVVEVRVKEGDQVKTGQVYLVLDSANGAPAAPPATPSKPAPAPKETPKAKEAPPAPRLLLRLRLERRQLPSRRLLVRMAPSQSPRALPLGGWPGSLALTSARFAAPDEAAASPKRT